MAVPFYLPDQDEQGASGSSRGSSGSSPSTTTSATQTPLSSPAPVNGEQLVQAFMEVLYRCSTSSSSAGSPGFQYPPPSPLCNTSPAGSYNDEVFFPRNRSTPRSPRNSFNDDGFFFRHPIPVLSASTRNGPQEPASRRRSRLTSTGDDDNEGRSEDETSMDELDERYGQYMAARDRLQEFPGRIPLRKKKDIKKNKEQSFTWPTVVTVFVFAVGCGFLVAR